jgi:hypothetical protein
MGGYITRMGEKNACRLSVGNPEGKRLIGRPRGIWMDNIKIGFREIGWDGMRWVNFYQDRDHWRALKKIVMSLRVPYNLGKLLSSCTTGSLFRRAQFREAS